MLVSSARYLGRCFAFPGSTGTYQITVAGASGGYGLNFNRIPGGGYVLQSEFTLSAGDVLNVVVGQMGSDNSSTNGGAGGGTFVWLESTGLSGQPLTVAGGGGGAGQDRGAGEQLPAGGGPGSRDKRTLTSTK